MDIYSTAELNRMVERLRPIPRLFLDTFFREEILSDKEEIFFDYREDRPRLAPFVHPLQQGKLVESIGYVTKSFKPAYIKDKRVHNPLDQIKRRAGEALTGSLSPAARAQLNLAADLQDQQDMLTRRLEVMAAEAIISGRQTVVGDGINAVVDYQRDPELTITLTSTAKWDDAGNTKQTDDLETWSELLLEKSGFGNAVVIMDRKAWKLFKRDTRLDKLLDNEYLGRAGTILNMAPEVQIEGALYKGMVGGFPIWVYDHPYVDPTTNTLTNVMPANTVVMASVSAVEGVRHFGAIMDMNVLAPSRQYVKSWENEDPSVRFLLSQSAPLMVPYRPNASIKITVA